MRCCCEARSTSQCLPGFCRRDRRPAQRQPRQSDRAREGSTGATAERPHDRLRGEGDPGDVVRRLHPAARVLHRTFKTDWPSPAREHLRRSARMLSRHHARRDAAARSACVGEPRRACCRLSARHPPCGASRWRSSISSIATSSSLARLTSACSRPCGSTVTIDAPARWRSNFWHWPTSAPAKPGSPRRSRSISMPDG